MKNKSTTALPVIALLLCALVGGTGWIPFRHLQALALHPLWATVFVYVLAVTLVGSLRPHAFAAVARSPALWALGFGFGAMNACFFWAVSIGDVVRVVLLFNLMPVWSALLARWLLKEAVSLRSVAAVAMALLGAALVLWPTGASGSWLDQLPVPTGAADWLGLAGGMAFALNNVLLRKGEHHSEESQVLAMFSGGIVVAGSVAIGLGVFDRVPWPPELAWPWVLITLLLGLWFLLGNFALQFGASRLPANVTSVVMLSEIVFATGSSALLDASQMGPLTWIGGMLIVFAAWLSVR